MMTQTQSNLLETITERFATLYGPDRATELTERLSAMIDSLEVPDPATELWSEKDNVLITYADSIKHQDEFPLETLHRFLRERARDTIRCVHLLPFYPWTSDDGFSVVDYREVKDEYGNWSHVETLGEDFDLMFDFVLNHCSSESRWFQQFIACEKPGKDYFVTADPTDDLSLVVRPRASDLLTGIQTAEGDKWVWTTFSSDQVDLNWQEPDLLFEFIDILFLYLKKGARILRLDAVAFLWKTIGTDCLHLPETHEVVKLFRNILDIVTPHAILLTETNVPHRENISYFGDGDEAHMVYNFSLPPLLLHGLLRGDATLLREWALSLPELPPNQAFLNFTASHDGIGVRPLQGLIDDDELDWLIGQVKQQGGQVSTRSLPDGSEAPYEMNISYVDALGVPGDEALSIRRFLCSQAVMLSLPGVPAIYIHSFLGTPNDQEGFEKLGYNRALNRKKWNLEELESILGDPATKQAKLHQNYIELLKHRASLPAMHPGAKIQILEDLPRELFAFHRFAEDGSGVLCVYNFSGRPIAIPTDLLSKSGGARDILGNIDISAGTETLELEPYAAHWLTNSE